MYQLIFSLVDDCHLDYITKLNFKILKKTSVSSDDYWCHSQFNFSVLFLAEISYLTLEKKF
jgi:hypothetical protein